MKVVVAGGTGFLGSALAASLRLDGHHVLVMTRHPKTHDEVPWTDPSVFDGADAVVNLAGEPLDAGRWTEARKASILESRIKSTETLVKGMSSVTRRPAVFLNASAVGFYGIHGPEALTEESPSGSGFLASVCVRWEASAMAAAWMTRVVLLRTGLPLDKTGGALPKGWMPPLASRTQPDSPFGRVTTPRATSWPCHHGPPTAGGAPPKECRPPQSSSS